jgi:hypothetical protein
MNDFEGNIIRIILIIIAGLGLLTLVVIFLKAVADVNKEQKGLGSKDFDKDIRDLK